MSSKLSGEPRVRVRSPRRTELGLLLFEAAVVVLFYIFASVASTSKIPVHLAGFMVFVLGLCMAAHVANRLLAPDANPALLPLVALLNGLGYIVVARVASSNPKWENLPGLQALWTAIGIGGYIITLAVVRRSRDLDRYRYLLLLAAVILMLAPLLPGIGVGSGGARLWIKLGPVTGQPIELAKILLCVFFASYFSENRELLSIPTARIGNRLVIDPRPLGPILLAWGFTMVVLGGEKDVGFALLVFVLFVSMLWLAAGRLAYVAFGVVMFGVGVVVAGHVLPQVSVRFNDWLHPVPTSQIMEGLYGLGNGGIVGSAIGFGDIGNIYVGYSDFIFAIIGTELGLLGTATVVFAFMLLCGAGLRIAQVARTEFSKLLATGLTLILGFQAFFIMAGILRVLPLTGMTLPFVAYGGSSLVANYIMVALLMRISDEGSKPALSSQATAQRIAA